MANNNSLPYFIERPKALGNGKNFIEPKPDGKYDITVAIKRHNPNDNGRYPAVAFIDGKLINGSFLVERNMLEYTFENVQLGKGDVELVLCSTRIQDPDYGTKLVIKKNEFKPYLKPEPVFKPTISVKVNSPGPDGKHLVIINLYDKDGNPVAGEVEITASQKFQIGKDRCQGYKKLSITNLNGQTVQIKPLEFNEGFTFVNSQSMEMVKETLLGGN